MLGQLHVIPGWVSYVPSQLVTNRATENENCPIPKSLSSKVVRQIVYFINLQQKYIIVTPLTTTRRYGPLRGPTSSSCGGLRPRGFFCPPGKKRTYYAVLASFRPFWCPVVTFVTFKRIKKVQKKSNFFK